MKMDIKKNLVIAAAIVCLFFLVSIRMRKEESIESEKNVKHEAISRYVENLDLNIAEANHFRYIYGTLNRDFFGNNVLIPWFDENIVQEIENYAESVKGDLIEVWVENSIVPQGLVVELENMIYQSLNSNMKKISWEEIERSIYYETMRKLGMEKWNPDLDEMKTLFPELNNADPEIDSVYDAYRKVSGNEYCYDLFHIPTPESDNYVLAISSGGSAGLCDIWLTKLVNGEFKKISSFETSNAGYGTVIQYENEFYYIFLQNNYSLKIYDGVRIYKLGENMEYENLLIKYLPCNYVWKNIYNTPEGMKWDSYVESIQEEVSSDEYLDNGTDDREWKVYFGDEEEVEDFIVPENEKGHSGIKCYQIDFANMGMPIYMRKWGFVPSNSHTTWHLRSSFYLRNPVDDSIVTLQGMELNRSQPTSGDSALVQMWFKEMEEKVYTFCLYHVSDYNYMLNVVRLEGNEVNRIRTDILSPKRQFVLTEGEKYVY